MTDDSNNVYPSFPNSYMVQRTPIGKMHPNDNRNYWTVVLDSANFAGPVVYSSAYHWEHPNSWQPVSTKFQQKLNSANTCVQPSLTLLCSCLISSEHQDICRSRSENSIHHPRHRGRDWCDGSGKGWLVLVSYTGSCHALGQG